MSTTRERIESDIKQHVEPIIDEDVKADIGLLTEENISESAMILAGRLQNLSSAGTKAGDSEMVVALEAISRKVAKKVIQYLKERYNL